LDIEVAQVGGRALIITADHGNCEQMVDPRTRQPHTAHTSNLVPFVIADEAQSASNSGRAARSKTCAPTMIGMLGLDKPGDVRPRPARAGD
jgi:2,3-bisphosphoglycerate-independent phosphoglycerate mutase